MTGERKVDDAPAPDFDAWVEPHLSVLAAIAVREVGRDAAEDVVQDALLRAWQRRETFDPDRGGARPWLVAVLLDRCRRHRVRSPRRPAPRGDSSVEADDGTRLDVEEAVRRLPNRQRQIVVLHYLADLPVTEVARVLDVTEGAVKAQLFNARAALRRSWGAEHDRG